MANTGRTEIKPSWKNIKRTFLFVFFLSHEYGIEIYEFDVKFCEHISWSVNAKINHKSVIH